MTRAPCLIALALLPIAPVAHAEVLAVCGASAGHGYYPPGKLVPQDKAGWREDGMSNGSFQLIRSGDDYDIIFTDATGGTLSAKGDGAKTLGIVGSNGDLVVLVMYERVVETWAFWFGAPGPLIATLSQVKHSSSIAKHVLFKADCKKT